MYIPKANAETRLPVLRQMMNDHPLAAVVKCARSIRRRAARWKSSSPLSPAPKDPALELLKPRPPLL